MANMYNYTFYGILIILLIPILYHTIRVSVLKRKQIRDPYIRICRLADSLETCKKENLDVISSELGDKSKSLFILKWNAMKKQISEIYRGTYIPKAEYFFPQADLTQSGSNGVSLRRLKLISLFCGLLLIVLPTVMIIGSDQFQWMMYLKYLSTVLLIYLVITFIALLTDNETERKLESDYQYFLASFNRVLPVCSADVALTYDMLQMNQKSFESGVRKITARFDGFASETVLPALKSSLSMISEQQQQGMRTLAEEFTHSLTDTLNKSLDDLSATISEIRSSLRVLRDDLSTNISSLNNLLSGQNELMDTSVKNLIRSEEERTTAHQEAETMVKQFHEQSVILQQQMGKLTVTTDRLEEQNQAYITQTNQIMEQTTQTYRSVSEMIQESQQKMTQAASQSAASLVQMSENMKESMSSAGKEIAVGIKEATGDNAEAIQQLAEQAQSLRNDYESYFSRIEEYSRNANEDMDYHVQNIISKISEEVGDLIQKNISVSQSVLNDYQESTAKLLAEFREQANSISLYAKEINLDVSELSANLNQSVSTFNQSVVDSVELTMHQFDDGLAELSTRIANTVASICDAVETLPKALGKK